MMRDNQFKLFNTIIYTNADALSALNRLLNKDFAGCIKVILADENTAMHCSTHLLQKCKSLDNATLVIIKIQSGEQFKTLSTAQKIWQTLNEGPVDRDAVFINLGGGVLSDIGSFCASTYKRGIRYINVPTTLLAMVDAAIGGKTAINLDHYKNTIGTFTQPEAVFIWNGFLSTLDKRNIDCGKAEMIKHALIADEKLWLKINSSHFNELENEAMIFKSIKIKCSIVKKDPLEKSLRKILNFGHTAGHAIESWSAQTQPKPLLHGECVAMGLVIESFLSFKAATLKKSEVKKIAEFIDANFLLKKFDKSAVSSIIDLMLYDKKNSKAKINFTLLDHIGKASIDHYCSKALIKDAFKFYNSIAE